jgi:hypothetical protein
MALGETFAGMMTNPNRYKFSVDSFAGLRYSAISTGLRRISVEIRFDRRAAYHQPKHCRCRPLAGLTFQPGGFGYPGKAPFGVRRLIKKSIKSYTYIFRLGSSGVDEARRFLLRLLIGCAKQSIQKSRRIEISLKHSLPTLHRNPHAGENRFQGANDGYDDEGSTKRHAQAGGKSRTRSVGHQ